METINPKPIEFKEIPGDNETIYTWTREGEELARVVAKEITSYYPRIEFIIKESVIPYYEDEKMSALDELGGLSMFADMQSETKDGFVHGSMKCSHNENLGIESLVRSVKGWIGKLKE